MKFLLNSLVRNIQEDFITFINNIGVFLDDSLVHLPHIELPLIFFLCLFNHLLINPLLLCPEEVVVVVIVLVCMRLSSEEVQEVMAEFEVSVKSLGKVDL